MQITLNQDEIHAAVEAYVRQQVAIQPTQSLTIDFTMGRTPNGLTAALDIRAAAAPVVKPAVTRAKVEVTPAPVVEEETAEAASEEDQDPEVIGSNEEEPAAEEEAKADAPAPKKIFGALKKEPAEEEEASSAEAPAPRKSVFSKAG